MARALELAVDPGAPFGENPRVGCVIADANGDIVGEGFHAGAGTPHAEVVALAQAGARARGGSAYVTLEPCAHIGRTGPCTQALLDAGIARVIFAQSDPNPEAAGGAEILAAAGVEVLANVLEEEALQVNREWTFALTHGRPFVTLKMAMSLDGRVANPDGSRRQLTGSESMRDVAELRSRVQAVLVGTHTAIVDNPQLTARTADGGLRPNQPLRVIVGVRPLPDGLNVLNQDAPTWVAPTRDLNGVLIELGARGIRHVLVEGGPTIAAALLDQGLVEELRWYVAPVLLGAGPVAVTPSFDGGEMAFEIQDVQTIGADIRIIAHRK